jgi:peptidoglycan/LPS O-acetylase OafA/YrhL
MPSTPSAEPAHLPALDGFRGIAILLVMLSHFLNAGHVVTEETWWGRVLLGGFVGVDMFFVLSGFLITGILLDARVTTARGFGVFYARRALRIFPLYYASLALVFLLRPAGPGSDSPWWYWTFASNLGATWKGRWLVSPEDFDLGHFWSLAVEEQFYLVWPFLVAALGRRHLAKACLACLVIAPVIHFALHFSGNPTGAYLFTGVRLHTLAAGAWLALAFRDPARWELVRRFAKPVLLITATLSLAALMFPRQISLIPFSPFLWGSALVLSVSSPGPWQNVLSTRPLLVLGRLSYGLYILHSLVDPWLKHVLHDRWILGLTGDRPLLALFLFLVAAFALSLAAAGLSWHLFEKPILSLKRYFRYPRTSTPAPSTKE